MEDVSPVRVPRVGGVPDLDPIGSCFLELIREQRVGEVVMVVDRELASLGVVDCENRVEVGSASRGSCFRAGWAQTLKVSVWPAAAWKLYQSTSSVFPMGPADNGGELQGLSRFRPVVGDIVGLGNDRIVDDDDEANRGNPLRRGNPDLARSERGVGCNRQGRLDGPRLPSPSTHRFRVGRARGRGIEHLTGQAGFLAKQLPGPVKPAAADDRELDGFPPPHGGGGDPSQHRIRRLRPGELGGEDQGEGGEEQHAARHHIGLQVSWRSAASAWSRFSASP